MYSISAKSWLAAIPLLVATTLFAQKVAPAESSTSAPTKQDTDPPAFSSALEGYRPFSDEKQIPWKEANETVRQVGGWRAYAKEAAAPTPDKSDSDPHRAHHAPQPKAQK
jgi:hypothetical protein